MKNFYKVLLLIVSIAFLVSCQTTTVELKEFVIDTDTVYLEIGDTYTIPKYQATLSNDEKVSPVVKVTDSKNEVISITDNKFSTHKLDTFKVTLTIEYNKEVLGEKSYLIETFDLTKPALVTDTHTNNYVTLGSELDLADFTATDNSNETIELQIVVKFNNEVIEVTDNKVVFDQVGSYVVEITAEDSSKNKLSQSYKFFTVLDAESGVSFDNEFVTTVVSDKHARTGNHSYEVSIMDLNINWFNDAYFLGEVFNHTEENIFSFWVLFDYQQAGFNGVSVFKRFSHETTITDNYGNKVEKNWQNFYEIFDAKWYRFEVKMDTFEPGYLEMNYLSDFFVEFGVWDYDISNNATKPVKMYVDDIKFISAEYDAKAEYDVVPVPTVPTEEDPVIVINDFEENAGYNHSEIINGLSKDFAYSGENSLKLTGYPNQGWLNVGNLFLFTQPEGVTRAYFRVYLSYDGTGEYFINDLVNAKFYTEAEGAMNEIQLNWQNLLPLPTNEWILVGFDITPNFQFVVENLWVGGSQVLSHFSIYIDDLQFIHESYL